MFLAIAKAYCEASDIVVDREVQLGRGPVDFKFSSGYRQRALLEVKKLENGRFWNGLRDQLPSYLGSDDCRDGWFLVVRFRSTDGAEKRARRCRRSSGAWRRNGVWTCATASSMPGRRPPPPSSSRPTPGPAWPELAWLS